MATAFELAWARTGKAEGGYSNNPSDPGGETNHGITIAVARRQGYKGEMRELPAFKAEEIAKREYWDVMRLDEVADISGSIADELFDTGFNMGPGTAIKFLQRQLNALNSRGKHYPDVVVDGAIGAATINALRAYDAHRGKDGTVVLLRGLNAEQICDYRRQAEANELKEDFYFGWLLNRAA